MKYSILAVAVLAACGGGSGPEKELTVDAPGSVGPGSDGDSHHVGGGNHDYARCDDPVAASAPKQCTSQQADIVGFLDNDTAFGAHIVGEWLSCTFPSIWGTSDEAGFAIHEDGTWANLYADAAGNLTESTSDDTRGTYYYFENGPYVQFNMSRASDGGTVITQPYFAETPQMVHLNNNGVYLADYIRNDTSGRCGTATPDPDAGPYTAPAACASLPATESHASPADAQIEVVGRWLSCSGTPFGMGSDNGIELVADGTFYRLYAAADGTIQREHGFNRQGTWTVIDNGTDFGQLNLQIADGEILSVPTFSAVSMTIDNEGVYTGRYIRE